MVATTHKGMRPELIIAAVTSRKVDILKQVDSPQLTLVKEVAGKQNTQNKHKQQTKIERSTIQLYRLTIGIWISFHSDFLPLNELHRGDRAQEEDCGHS